MLGMLWLPSAIDTAVAQRETRPDGRPRLPPGQRVLRHMKPMGGSPGSPRISDFSLRVHGEVENEYRIDFGELNAMPTHTEPADVHCVTGWSCLGLNFRGVRVADLAERAGVRGSARQVIFEAARGYTANLPLREALDPAVKLVWSVDGEPLSRAHGGPVRALVPDLYFWKSAKWITGIRFSERVEAGYWERRGYHIHGDPWREERHSR